MLSLGGGWDETTQTLKWNWTGPDGSNSSATWHWRDPDHRESTTVLRDAVGNTTLEFQEMSTRRAEPGFVPLFNGKDVPGTLTARADSWHIEGRLLVGTGENAGLKLRKDLQDFHCRIEAKVVVPGMANVDFRTTWSPAMISGQAVLESRTVKNRTGGLALFMAPKAGQLLVASPNPPSSPDGWFTLEIIAEGKKATIKVDGATTAERTIPELPDRGDLVLSIVDKGAVIHFRKIEIKELPTTQHSPKPANPVRPPADPK